MNALQRTVTYMAAEGRSEDYIAERTGLTNAQVFSLVNRPTPVYNPRRGADMAVAQMRVTEANAGE